MEGEPAYWASAQHRLTAASQSLPGPPGPKQLQLRKPHPGAAPNTLDVDSRQRSPHPLGSHTELSSGAASSAFSDNSFKGLDAEVLCERPLQSPFMSSASTLTDPDPFLLAPLTIVPDDSESWKGDSRGSNLRGPLRAPAFPQEGHLIHFTLIHPPACHRMTIGPTGLKESKLTRKQTRISHLGWLRPSLLLWLGSRGAIKGHVERVGPRTAALGDTVEEYPSEGGPGEAPQSTGGMSFSWTVS